jgi:homoserine kinase type II
MTDTEYVKLLNAWNLDFTGMDSSAPIEGSPERAAARVVVRDADGTHWILEQIEEKNLAGKQQIAEQLEALSAVEPIHPYRRTADGSFFSNGWMLRPYVDGIPLQRPGYLDDLWRIDAMADFLIRLRQRTDGMSGPVFSICDYAQQRMAVWRSRTSALAGKLERSFQTLEKTFFPVHDQLPVSFCHGDFHPLNIVWGTESIRSVIDWEFCGIKPELYDAALLVGCIGFEDPDNLIKEPVIRLVHRLRSAGYGSDESWAHFLELTATIRTGWMSEWIRRHDREARQMEFVYIDILVDQRDFILERIF